jgi:hypothetical protein
MRQSEHPRLITEPDLAQLADAAAASTRRRSHILLHADHQDQVQRLLIALERTATCVRSRAAELMQPLVRIERGEFVKVGENGLVPVVTNPPQRKPWFWSNIE